jgi:ATP-binding cassette, subfamily C (CFTR/MRP), member 1
VSWIRAGDSDGLGIAVAFISLALVALVSTPVAELVGGRAVFSGALACLERTQEFLLLEDKDVCQQ